MTVAVKPQVPDFDPNVRSTPTPHGAVLEALSRATFDREAGTLALPDGLERGVLAGCRRRLEEAGASKVGRTNRYRFPDPEALAAFLKPSKPEGERDADALEVEVELADPERPEGETRDALEPPVGTSEPDEADVDPLEPEPGAGLQGEGLPGEVAEAVLELLPEDALESRAFAPTGSEPLADLLRDKALEAGEEPGVTVLALESLPLEPAFDLGLVLLTPEVDPDQALARSLAALRPGGRLVVAAPGARTLAPEADALPRPQVEAHLDVEDETTGRTWHVLALRGPQAVEVEPIVPDSAIEPLERRVAEYREVPFDRIVELEGHNPRRTIRREGIEELAEEVACQGLLQPLRLRPLPNGRFAVVFGHRRHRAIGLLREAGRWPLDRPVPALVGEANEGEATLLALAENEAREDVNPLEQAEGYARLRLRGHTIAEIAFLRGRTERFVAQRLGIGLGVCEEAKRLYREGGLDLAAIEALSAQPKEAQANFLESAPRYTLSADQIRGHFRRDHLTMEHARFTLEAYRTAGGQAQEDLFEPAATTLADPEVARRLQQVWLEGERVRRLEEGWAWAAIVPSTYQRYSHREGGTRGDGAAGVLLQYNPGTLRVEVSEGLLPRGRGYGIVGSVEDPLCERPVEEARTGEDGTSPGATAGAIPNPNVTRLGLEPGIRPEAPKAEYTKAFVAKARTLRSAALQAGLLEGNDGKLGLALTVLGLMGVKRVHVKSHDRSGSDRVAAPVLEKLRFWAWRLQALKAKVDEACEVERSARWNDSAAVPLLEALLGLSLEELLELNLALVSARVGDWNEHGATRKSL